MARWNETIWFHSESVAVEYNPCYKIRCFCLFVPCVLCFNVLPGSCVPHCLSSDHCMEVGCVTVNEWCGERNWKEGGAAGLVCISASVL